MAIKVKKQKLCGPGFKHTNKLLHISPWSHKLSFTFIWKGSMLDVVRPCVSTCNPPPPLLLYMVEVRCWVCLIYAHINKQTRVPSLRKTTLQISVKRYSPAVQTSLTSYTCVCTHCGYTHTNALMTGSAQKWHSSRDNPTFPHFPLHRRVSRHVWKPSQHLSGEFTRYFWVCRQKSNGACR